VIPEGERLRHTILVQALAWVALWGFWVVVSRHNHPSLVLNAVASALLVATFAGTVHLNQLRLIPRLWDARRFTVYGGALLLAMGGLALACTAAIHIVYDLLWGPDPARFGFWTNFGMEFVLIAIHVLVASASIWLIGWISRKPGCDDRAPGPVEG
jgi:hypothetical protein